jgi:hypothetical protein
VHVQLSIALQSLTEHFFPAVVHVAVAISSRSRGHSSTFSAERQLHTMPDCSAGGGAGPPQ